MGTIDIIKRNMPRPPKAHKGYCEGCGTLVPKFTLVRQRGRNVSYWHRGCLDTGIEYDRSHLQRPAQFGKQP